VHVEGTLIEVPDLGNNMELQLCISSISSDPIVVLAHHTDNPTKVSAYYSSDNCLRPPTAGIKLHFCCIHSEW